MATPTQTTAASGTERIDQLQRIEQDIGSLLLHLADAVDELSKQSPSSDTVEHKTKDFLKSLESVERGLTDQIQYLSQVSTSRPHEGSAYGAIKDYELGQLQSVLAKERLQQFAASLNHNK